MSEKLFGTDGVRGTAGTWPINLEGAYDTGLATARHFAQDGEAVVIGYDTRESSPRLAEAIANGIVDAGGEVQYLGVIPSPGVAYTTRESDAAAGIVVTASHNPWEDNGFKFYGPEGEKLSDADEAALERGIISAQESLLGDRRGARHDAAELQVSAYERFLTDSVPIGALAGRKLVIDTANGAASGIAERVFNDLGAEVIPMFDQPNGRNINAGCGATDVQALTKAAAELSAIGVAFDGDADRLHLVDERGRLFHGDHILYLLAATGGAAVEGVVGTSMSNMGLEIALRKRDQAFLGTDVGDRHVSQGLRETGFPYGGEPSGHIIIPEILATGDGMLAAIQSLYRLDASPLPTLAEWYDDVPLLEQHVVNVPTENRDRIGDQAVQDFYAAEIAELEAEYGNDFRLNIRASGTQQVVRVMFEGNGAQRKAQAVAEKLAALLNA